MKKIAYTIDLVDDADLADEYCRLHADVWPEVRDGLRSVGVRELHAPVGQVLHRRCSHLLGEQLGKCRARHRGLMRQRRNAPFLGR